MSLKITMMAEGELAFKNHLLIEAFVLPSANPNLRRKRLGDINLHAHKCIHRMSAERPQDAFRWSRMAVTEGPSIRELCNEGCIETGGSFRDFNGRKGNGWSTIESRGLFRSRISGKIGLTGALVTAGEEEEVPARIEAKDGLGAGGSPGADGGAAKAAMPGEQAKP
ncbi:hypothetical protein L2E82_53364 [Cichorium intybus]|nr:hypothetical protein L2E82_53364 [Cichorium intybus]